MIVTEQHGAGQQPGYVPPPHLIEEGNDLLHDLQKILSNLGTDERRNSPEFQQIMGIYKAFGTDLHQAKRKVEAAKPPPPQKATTIQARPATPARPGPAPGPHHPPAGAPSRLAPTPAGPEPAPPAPAAETSVPAEVPAPLPLPRFEATLGPAGKPGAIAMGEEVGYLQQLLTHLGYQTEETEVFDRRTLQAVQEFQKAHGLEPTGLVGADMRALLNQMVTG